MSHLYCTTEVWGRGHNRDSSLSRNREPLQKHFFPKICSVLLHICIPAAEKHIMRVFTSSQNCALPRNTGMAMDANEIVTFDPVQ